MHTINAIHGQTAEIDRSRPICQQSLHYRLDSFAQISRTSTRSSVKQQGLPLNRKRAHRLGGLPLGHGNG
jgi:hypothetical protein